MRNAKKKPDVAVPSRQGEGREAALARFALRPSLHAAVTIRQYTKALGEVDLQALMDELVTQIGAVQAGDLDRGEAMLTAQAHSLDALFNNLAQRAANAEYLNQAETYMKLALRAQAQARATWETLAGIKNPQPVAFVRQANIAHGPQQVNNAAGPPVGSSRAGESENRPNELLEAKTYECLDAGTAATAGNRDPTLAALE